MADPKHLLHNLKWRLHTLEAALENVQLLIQQIKTELARAGEESKQ